MAGLVEKGLEILESKGKKLEVEGSSDSERAYMNEKLMKDVKALGIIQGAVLDDIFPKISNEETSKDAWDILHQEFYGDKQVRSIKLQGLCRDFEYIRIRDDETLSVYLTRLLELVQEGIAALRGFAQCLDRHAGSTTERAFSSMSVSPDRAFSSMNVNPKGTQPNSSCGNSKPKKNWKSKGKKWDPKAQNLANQGGKYDQGGKSDQSKGKCKHCDKLHYGECWFKGKLKCHGCNQFSHLIKDYDQPNKAEKLVNFANQVTESATMFYACHSTTIGRNMNIWCVDSACSNHITSHESLLIDVDKNVKCRVKMGIGDLVQSKGKGTLVIEMKGVTRYIKEVLRAYYTKRCKLELFGAKVSLDRIAHACNKRFG
ncbi:uncharacterized protein [Malus domestica]|uniref:uncharacterized protein n=1 Tax=Malus domestica TaxID=3750 RepID=UPI0039748FF1